jgi:UDP-galactopyranose mutase
MSVAESTFKNVARNGISISTMKYDVVIVGAGLSGCVFAEILSKTRKNILVIDKRNHIGGNCFDYFNDHGILIHKYGIHCFHTNGRRVWGYLSDFTDWHYYQHKVLSFVDGNYLAFPVDAKAVCFDGYTKKQWGNLAEALDKSVLDRVKTNRCANDDRYFTDRYQGVPKHGYTKMFEKMLDRPNISILLQTEWAEVEKSISYDQLIYTGRIDEFFKYDCGKLPFRSLKFEYETLDQEVYQQVAQVNYPVDYDFTRIIEFKHATGQKHGKTTIMREYPVDQVGDLIPFYPVPCKATEDIVSQYIRKNKGILAGRLGNYKYMNMDEVVLEAIQVCEFLVVS